MVFSSKRFVPKRKEKEGSLGTRESGGSVKMRRDGVFFCNTKDEDAGLFFSSPGNKLFAFAVLLVMTLERFHYCLLGGG